MMNRLKKIAVSSLACVAAGWIASLALFAPAGAYTPLAAYCLVTGCSMTGALSAPAMTVNPASGNAVYDVTSAMASQAIMQFQDGGVTKWQLGKQGGDSWFQYDTANGHNFLTTSTSGLVALGENSQVQLPLAGNVGIGTATPGALLEVNGAGLFDGIFTIGNGTASCGGSDCGFTLKSPYPQIWSLLDSVTNGNLYLYDQTHASFPLTINPNIPSGAYTFGTATLTLAGISLAANGGISDSALAASMPLYTNGSSALSTSAPSSLAGTTASIGGSALAAGACSSGTLSLSAATNSMAVSTTPTTYPGDAIYWRGYVSAAGTVTVKACATVAATPTSSVYVVRVTP